MFFINWQLALLILLVFPPVLVLTPVCSQSTARNVYHHALIFGQRHWIFARVFDGRKNRTVIWSRAEVESKYQGYTDDFLRAQLKTNKYDASLFFDYNGDHLHHYRTDYLRMARVKYLRALLVLGC